MLSTHVHHLNVVNTLYVSICGVIYVRIIIYDTLLLPHAMSCIVAFCTIRKCYKFYNYDYISNTSTTVL